MDTKDHIGLMGSWLATLVEVSVLTPDAPEAVLGRISSMCTAAFAQWLKQKDDERVGSRQSLEDAVHSVDFKGLAQEQGFSKDFAALAVKALAEFRKSLFKAGSGGRRGAQAWGATLLRQLASA